MPKTREVPARSERFPVTSCRSRWLEGFDLDHATLCAVEDVSRVEDALVVRRAARAGRRVGEGRVPRPFRAPLLLQAAAAAAFFASRGFPMSASELDDAVWDLAAGTPRLWIRRAPAALTADAEETPVSEALASVILRIFASGCRAAGAGARTLLVRLAEPEAGRRRGDHWVTDVLRAFPELSSPAAAVARERCLGLACEALRPAAARAVSQKARALVSGRIARIFFRSGSPLEAGSALGLSPPPASLPEATRRLLDLGAAGEETWIAVEPRRWDLLSRRAFDAARLALGSRVESATVEELSPPVTPAEWRRAIWMPCAAAAASVRLWEAVAARAAAWPGGGAALARHLLRSPGWAAYASDPTGDAPLFFGEPGKPPGSAAVRGDDPASRIERLLDAGDLRRAFTEAERWVRSRPDRAPEAWFSLAARLSAAGADFAAPWHEEIEAERELSGGRPSDARERLERLARCAGSDHGTRRRARLRLAEIAVMRGRHVEAARKTAAWRREHPDAPAGETVRALRLGASGLSREGRADCALALLDEAHRIGAGLAFLETLETALCRGRVLARAGRFEEEDRLYEDLRLPVARSGDARAAARLLAQEARALLDRREHAGAVVRFEEAREAATDPSEKAELLLDLAAAVYHAGGEDRDARCEAILEEALAAAAAAGREDLARGARGNRIEVLVNRGAWARARAEIAALESSARSERDDCRLLVALHHRSRLALRRGFLDDAARDNAEARRLAERLADRLEIGELWLEEGDRRVYAGDREGARSAYSAAAEDPPDRCDSEVAARSRLEELTWAEGGGGGPPPEARSRLDALFVSDAYAAAETAARWTCLFGEGAVPVELRGRACGVLQERGGEELARRVFGAMATGVPEEALRQLRDAVSAALAGAEPALDGAFGRLGIAGIALRAADGSELARLPGGPVPREAEWQSLEAGRARFAMAVWPRPAPEVVSAVSLLLETLLFRPPEAPSRSGVSEGWARLGVVASDVSMDEPYRRLERFAPQPVSVLLLGESGSGKEALARAVHRLSSRSAGPFVAVNVPAVPPALIESELFGHARGAFTGADRDRRGLLEEATGGTVFLDEIGDLALPLQAKLLRALQEREIRRVGENRARAIDVRVVSATSRDLAAEVEAGRFREDLYYRLDVAAIRLPPLRERGRDALLLARRFLERYGREYGRGALSLSAEAAGAISTFSWPGNVRQLQNAMAHAAALCDAGGVVTPDHLPASVRPPRPPAPAAGDYRTRVDAHRRDLIADALDRAGGNRSRAARDLGLSRQALLYLIRELRVPVAKAER